MFLDDGGSSREERLASRVVIELHFGKGLYNGDGLNAEVDDTEKEVEDIPRVSDLGCPIVRVVTDTTLLMNSDLVPFHDPLDSALSVHHIFVRFQRDAVQGD